MSAEELEAIESDQVTLDLRDLKQIVRRLSRMHAALTSAEAEELTEAASRLNVTARAVSL